MDGASTGEEKHQDKNITQDTHETQDIQTTQDTRNTQDTQNTEQTRNTDTTNITQELLALLSKQSVSAVGNAVGGAEGVAFATPVASPSAPGAVGVKVEAREARPTNLQAKTTSEPTALTRQVDCRPCGGCCNGVYRVGPRLPVPLYELVRLVAEGLGVPVCRVVNEYLCGVLDLLRSGGGGVRVSERGLSRRVQYKAGYLLKMVGEAGELGQVVDRLILAVREYLEYAERRRVGVEEARQKVEELARELGFSGIRDFALYIWWLVPSRVVRGMGGLIDPGFVERRGPYVDVLSVRCLLPHGSGGDWQVHTTMDLPRFLRALVTHFKYVHGLTDWRQVVQWVLRKPWREVAINQLGGGEGEVRHEDWDQLSPSLRLYLFEDVLSKLIDVLIAIGLVEDLGGGNYKCVLDGVVVKGRFNVYKHLRSEHRDLVNVVRSLVKSLAGTGVVADESAE
jgi:hypothetical protein